MGSSVLGQIDGLKGGIISNLGLLQGLTSANKESISNLYESASAAFELIFNEKVPFAQDLVSRMIQAEQLSQELLASVRLAFNIIRAAEAMAQSGADLGVTQAQLSIAQQSFDSVMDKIDSLIELIDDAKAIPQLLPPTAFPFDTNIQDALVNAVMLNGQCEDFVNRIKAVVRLQTERSMIRPEIKGRSDINGDGKIDDADVTALMNSIGEMIDINDDGEKNLIDKSLWERLFPIINLLRNVDSDIIDKADIN